MSHKAHWAENGSRWFMERADLAKELVQEKINYVPLPHFPAWLKEFSLMNQKCVSKKPGRKSRALALSGCWAAPVEVVV